MNKAQLNKLTRVLGLLSSNQDGERAAAALAASRLVDQLGVTWAELLQHHEPRPKELVVKRVHEYGIEHHEAAEARMRQLKASNKSLETENKRLRTRLATMAEQARKARYDGGEDEI